MTLTRTEARKVEIDIQLRPWQKEAFRTIHKHRACFLSVHRRGGKSFLLSWMALRFLLTPATKPEWLLLLAPSQTQVIDTLAVPTANLAKSYGIPVRLDKVRGILDSPHSQNQIRLANMRQGLDHLRGYQLAGAFIDEVGMIPGTMHEIQSVIYPALASRHLSLFVVCGTPPTKHNAYLEIKKGMQARGYPVLEYPLSKTGLLTDKQVEILKGDPIAFNREFELKMMQDSNIETVVTMQQIESLFDAQPLDPDFMFPGQDCPVMGLDLGVVKDKSIATVRLYNCIMWQKELKSRYTDNLERLQDICDQASQFAHEKRITLINYDQGAHGSLLQERFERNSGGMFEAVGVGFGLPAFRHRSIRNDIAYKTWLFFRNRKAFINEFGCLSREALIQELSSAELKIENGVCTLEPKKNIGKKIGRSPDHLDSLMLTFHGFQLPDTATEEVITQL